MAEPVTTAMTQAPRHEAGSAFPPFDQTTYPSQFFWLAVTFAFLFVVLWKVSGPRIKGAISNRRGAINGAIAAAAKARAEADMASADYDRALATARARSQALAEETHQKINAEIAAEKAKAEALAAAATADADARIAATRTAAMAHIMGSARDAAIAIVARLTGETVSADEADAAVGNGAVGG